MVGEPVKTNMAPLFEAYGAACYWAQILERSFKLLLLMLLDKKRQGHLVVSTPLDTEEGLRTLGNLLKDAQEKKYITEAEHQEINKAISDRNNLVHAYWDRKSLSIPTTEGRQQIIDELAQIRKSIRYAAKITNFLVDKKQQENGISLKSLGSAAMQEWESDQETMNRLLRSDLDNPQSLNRPH
jgi:hypothetical protein